jgi:hypothetical protein
MEYKLSIQAVYLVVPFFFWSCCSWWQT